MISVDPTFGHGVTGMLHFKELRGLGWHFANSVLQQLPKAEKFAILTGDKEELPWHKLQYPIVSPQLSQPLLAIPVPNRLNMH